MNSRVRRFRSLRPAPMRGLFTLLAFAFAWFSGIAVAGQPTLRLSVYLPQDNTRETYQPLADYLSSKTGRPVELVTSLNFLTHWQLFKRENFEIVLDGPHFTDYRVQKMGYRPLVKLPSVVSYSLVTNEDTLVLEAKELVARKVATLPSPGLGALWLNTIFPNPLQQPEIVEVDHSAAAVEKVLSGEAAAAMIPTPFVQRYRTVVPVVTTRQVPAPALSVNAKVDKTTARQIREALLSAGTDPRGRAMLDAIGIPAFEPANAGIYKGQASALEGVWGY
jgi:ABC-type phosphate/phosphonate transport system substrate-binding protein